MRHFKSFFWFFAGMSIMFACATVKYKYYGLELPLECYDQGTLLGVSPNDKDWPDIPFNQCKPDQTVKGKCIIQKSDEFFAKDEALKQCQALLDECQRGPNP